MVRANHGLGLGTRVSNGLWPISMSFQFFDITSCAIVLVNRNSWLIGRPCPPTIPFFCRPKCQPKCTLYCNRAALRNFTYLFDTVTLLVVLGNCLLLFVYRVVDRENYTAVGIYIVLDIS